MKNLLIFKSIHSLSKKNLNKKKRYLSAKFKNYIIKLTILLK